MKRTTVYLPEELKAALERTAKVQGKSEAEVMRTAIAAATAEDGAPEPRALFDSGLPGVAHRVDEVLAEGFGEW